MKLGPVLLAIFALLLAGCAGTRGNTSASQSPNSPAGTDVGTSFPGVNQPTTITTATRSDSATEDIPNSRR